MQAQGSTSTPHSFDSLSSSNSSLFSDSEQAEDDTDVFLTDSSPSVGVGEKCRPTAKKNVELECSGSQWVCDSFTDKEEDEKLYRSRGSKGACINIVERESTRQTPKSEGDLLFAQKCAELQGFVRPLLELLNGLKRGRFDHGLSSFQQSVAMDRIQRIVGVLQRPNCGEKYLNTLLQVEVMLKVWFPQISAQPASTPSRDVTSPNNYLQETFNSTPPHKHRDQLHIPVKKRRLSWTGADSPSHSPVPIKCPHSTEERRPDQDEKDHLQSSPLPVSDTNKHPPEMASKSQLDNLVRGKDSDGEEPGKRSKYNVAQTSEPSLTWVHVAPILSPRKTHMSNEGVVGLGNNESILTTNTRGNPAMQDSSISSTTISKHPTDQKQIRCQSQPAVETQDEKKTTETCHGQSQLSTATLQPLPTTSKT